jgi:hypothetical protein
MARQAFLHVPIGNALAGGCVAYAAATLVFILVLLKPGSWRDIKDMKLGNAPWFLAAAVLVAHITGVRLRFASDRAADGGDTDLAAFAGLPALPLAMDQSRLRGHEYGRAHWGQCGRPGIDPGRVAHRRVVGGRSSPAFLADVLRYHLAGH